MGSIYKRGKIWWLKYYQNGKPHHESSESTKKRDAERILKIREGDVGRGKPIAPNVRKVTLGGGGRRDQVQPARPALLRVGLPGDRPDDVTGAGVHRAPAG